MSSATTGTSRKKKRSQGGKRKSGQAGLKEKMEPKWTHYSKQDLRTKPAKQPKIDPDAAKGRGKGRGEGRGRGRGKGGDGADT